MQKAANHHPGRVAASPLLEADRKVNGERSALHRLFDRGTRGTGSLDDHATLQEAIDEIEQKGFVHAEPSHECHALHDLLDLAAKKRAHPHPALVRLAQLFLAQPSCTNAVVTFARWGTTCLQRLFGYHPTWLPVALALHRKCEQPLAWTSWLVEFQKLPTAIEFALRYLLADGVAVTVLSNVDPVLQASLLEQAKTRQMWAPYCTTTRLIYQLITRLAANSCQANAVETLALRRWLKQQLADLPSTLLSTQLRDQMMEDSISALPSLIDHLTHRPQLVLLDECNEMQHSLLLGMDGFEVDHWLSLASLVPTLLVRIAAMRCFPQFRPFRGALILAAVTGGVDSPLDQLLVALLDVAIRHSTPVVLGVSIGHWFSDLASSSHLHCMHRGVDLLAQRGVLTDPAGREFVWFLFREARVPVLFPWLSAYEGSDWPMQAISCQRAILAHSHPIAVSQPERQALDQQLRDWTDNHWPAIRADVEVHLISDLAEMVLAYLQTPAPQDPEGSDESQRPAS